MAAKAASERLQNGTSTLDVECAEIGLDAEEVFERVGATGERVAHVVSSCVRVLAGGSGFKTNIGTQEGFSRGERACGVDRGVLLVTAIERTWEAQR